MAESFGVGGKVSECPRCAAAAESDDRFCRECGGYLTAAPSFDDLEPREAHPDDAPTREYEAPTREHEASTRGYPDPVEFAGPPVPAVDPQPEQDAWQDVVSPPTMDGWSDVAAGWYSTEPTRHPDVETPYAYAEEWQPSFNYGDQYDPMGGYGDTPTFQPYGGQQSDYTHYGQPPQAEPSRKARGRGVLVVCVIVLAVLLLGTVGMLVLDPGGDDEADPKKSSTPSSSGKSSPSATPNTPQGQAKEVDKVLTRGSSGKNLLTTAYEDANECSISPTEAKAKFENAAKDRRATVRSARRLDTGKLENGARIKSLMIAMYNTSAKADDAFALWAADGVEKGDDCLSPNGKRSKGNKLSTKAGKKKKQFVDVWNPVAENYGHSKRSKGGL